MKINIYILSLVALLATNFSQAQTTLKAGDIAILQYNADGSPEVIKFLALKGMEAGTTINFTDNGWKSNNTFRTGEGIHTWIASGNIISGDVITVTLTNISLNAKGDQLLAYQGTTGSPTFLYAINNQGGTNLVWQTTANNAKNSALPLGLTNGVNAIALREKDNVKYNSSTLTGSKTAILSAISTNANWGGSNTVTQTFSGTFTSKATWTGSWDGTGAPGDYFKAIIASNYTNSSPSFTTQELQINSGFTLTVGTGKTVTVQNNITNNGTILVETDGALYQETSDGTNTTGSGTYTLERTSTTLNSRFEFVYWSSPMTSGTLAEIAADASLHYSFIGSTQTWTLDSSSTTPTIGFGYAVQGPNSGHTYPGTYTASFSTSTGAFNNGDISVNLGFSDDTDPETDWNLIGNPYPSAVDANAFLAANSSVIGGTLYFWTHNTPETAGTNNTNADYVLWNATGGTASCLGCIAPDGNIATGQGFFAQALASGTVSNLFTNAMRISTAGNNNNFYKGTSIKEVAKKDKIWLNINSESDTAFNQILIGFFKNATNGVDHKYDGLRLDSGGSLNFHSIIDDNPYAIQGKSALTTLEEIPLGFSSTKTGSFKISIDHLEGNLNYSVIHLLDKELNVSHYLNDGAYTFTISNTGTNNDRFALRILTRADIVEEVVINVPSELIVAQNNNQFEIKTNNQDAIQQVLIYDILGREISSTNIEGKTMFLSSLTVKPNSIFIVKVILKNGTTLSQKYFKK